MPLTIGSKLIGPQFPTFIIAEIGINHNGDLSLAKKLIDVSIEAGCDAVKFQKRTPEICVPQNQWDIPRETPWGLMSYLDYKKRIEFGADEYKVIDDYCREKNMLWFASCWDVPSVEFMENFEPPCYKIASASVTDIDLLDSLARTNRALILSTGMSSWDEVARAVSRLPQDKLAILHSISTYPAAVEDLNLSVINTLWDHYQLPIGYSGHEKGVVPSVLAVAHGACVVERHITLDRTLWGTDQAASLEPKGLQMLVKEIRNYEKARGDGVKRVLPAELEKAKSIRRH